MTSETLNGIETFSSNLAFDGTSANGDGSDINDEIGNFPVFLSTLNVENYESASDSQTSDKQNNVETMENVPVKQIDTTQTEVASSESNSTTTNRTIEKLRIVIPPTASPTSMHSSSSDSHSPVRSKKTKKRFCIKCNSRFKHTVDWLKHLEKHISLPTIKLTKVDTNDKYYKDYMERATKRARSPSDSDSLKIRVKIPRPDVSNPIQENSKSDSETVAMVSPNSVVTPPASNECRIRVLRAEEIKQSPPRPPVEINFPENAMVSVPSDNRIHYECPTFDGLGQFAEEAMNDDATAQILKQLLETPPEASETNEWDSTTNEFISIDRLAHTCETCNEKYPDLNFLHEHQRLTGHGQKNFTPPSILEPIQEMTVDPVQQYHPPQSTSNLEQLLSQPKIASPTQPPMYGQPPVLPIHQMENQVRNFPHMNQMQNRPRFAMPPRHPSQLPPNYPMHRYLPPSQMVRSNQPLNMAPFYDMNPDMYNPQQIANNNNNNNNKNITMNGNVFNRPPNHMMNHFMPQPPPQQNMMQRFPMQQPSQRPPMNGPHGMNRSIRNTPPYPLRPSMNNTTNNSMNNSMGKPMPTQRPMMPASLNPHELQQKARSEQGKRNREIENRPFISNAPRTEGLPVIESVQSGAITLNSTKKPSEIGGTIQISDQITLSVKNKDLIPTALKPPEKSTPQLNDTNKMKDILANRGITVKSATKLLDKSKAVDDANKTPYVSAEAAVQKLQMNNSVSIISKKRVTPPVSIASSTQSAAASIPVAKENDTIDLSNDDDTPAPPPTAVTSRPRQPILRCSFGTCQLRFTNAKALRDHNLKVHHFSRLSKFRCTICSVRFPTNEAVRLHIQKMHPNEVKPKHELGIPIVDFSDPTVRKKMLSLGFINFLPITNVSDDKSEMYGMPIININGPSINNLKNLFDTNSTKVMKINSMRTIPRPKLPPASTQSLQSIQPSQANQSPRPVPKLISANTNIKPSSTDTSTTLPK